MISGSRYWHLKAPKQTHPTPKWSRPYFVSSVPHIRTTTISSMKQSKTNFTHLSRRNKATSASDRRPSRYLEFSPVLESWSDIYMSPTSCLIVTPHLHRMWVAQKNTLELIIFSDAVYTGCRDTTNLRQLTTVTSGVDTCKPFVPQMFSSFYLFFICLYLFVVAWLSFCPSCAMMSALSSASWVAPYCWLATSLFWY